MINTYIFQETTFKQTFTRHAYAMIKEEKT